MVEHLGIHTVAYATVGEASHSFCCVLPGNVPVIAHAPLAIGIRAEDCHLFDANGAALTRRVELSAFDPGLIEAASA